MIICLDTETTGVDFHHGCKPFFVSITTEDFETVYWEWDVNPLDRQPSIPEEDKQEIRDWLNRCEVVVMHNSLFDVAALRSIDIEVDWSKVFDTMLSAHLLNNLHRKSLTAQAAIYLKTDLDIYEDAVEKATKKCRSIARSKHKDWLIAKEGVLPSIKSGGTDENKSWKADMWLCKLLGFGEALEEYANADTVATMALYFEHQKQLVTEDQKKIIVERHKLLPITNEICKNGFTFSMRRLKEVRGRLQDVVNYQEKRLEGLARWHDFELELPDGAANDNIKEFAFEVLKLPVLVTTDKGSPSLNKEAMAKYQIELERNTKQYVFLDAFKTRKEALSKLNDLCTYIKFGIQETEDTYRLYPSLNPVGTKTLRWSSRNPNAQQIDKHLRYVFGPAEGREWWSLDYNNLELRIPAYLCQEPLMVNLFEDPNSKHKGSYHLLIFDILHPEKFAKHGEAVKEIYKSSVDNWYGYTKNFNFADQYNASEATCDKSAHVKGAKAKVSSQLPLRDKLNTDTIKEAQKNTFVYTIPDSELGLENGYPLHCEFQWGKVKPTVPLNFKVQGTAGWILNAALIECAKYLKQFDGYRIVLTVHDEIVFDFPYKPNRGNEPIIQEVRRIMEKIGVRVNVPLTVGVDYNKENWAESV